MKSRLREHGVGYFVPEMPTPEGGNPCLGLVEKSSSGGGESSVCDRFEILGGKGKGAPSDLPGPA